MTLRSGTTGRRTTPPRTFPISVTYHDLIDMTLRHDYGNDMRQGNRIVSIGEKPYFDPKSRSRREALGLDKLEF
jgi:hypothetical protein